MTHSEALQLADKISRTWRGHITLDIWTETIEPLDYTRAEQAWRELRDSEDRQPSVAQFRARYATFEKQIRDGHALSCMCGGSGFVTVTQRDDQSTWEAFARCPDGPPTLFIEPSKDYDPVAGAEAFATFNAFAATAETRADLANACAAAAAAYANACRRTLQ